MIGNRNDHERRHAGLRPYECPVAGCQKSYFRKYQLVSHGQSIMHRDIPTELFSLLMFNMPTPDLTVSGVALPQHPR